VAIHRHLTRVPLRQNIDIFQDSEFIWFALYFHFARRGIEGWRELLQKQSWINSIHQFLIYQNKK